MKAFFTLLLLIGAVAAASGQSLSSIPASFVDIGFGTRPVAMGGAFTAMSNDVNTMMWNPAGLASLKKNEATFAYTNQLGLIVYQFAGAAVPLDTNGRSIGIAAISSGDQALRELTLQGTYAHSFSRQLKLGITLKYRNATYGSNTLNAGDFSVFDQDEIAEGIANQVKGSANGAGLDIGVLFVLSRKVRFGATIKDIYAPVVWYSKTKSSSAKTKGEYIEYLPAEAALGSSVQVLKNFVVNIDFNPALSTTVSSKLRAGGELILLDMIALRSGVLQYFDNNTAASYSIGIGINVPIAKKYGAIIDYTYVQHELAATQRLSVGVEF